MESKGILGIVVAIFLTVSSSTMIFAETESSIPKWIRESASWWSQEKISDGEFLSAIQYLIDNNILQVNPESSEITLEKFEELKDKNRQVMIENREIQNQLDSITKKYDSLLDDYQEEVSISNALVESYEELYDESKNYENNVNEWIKEEQSKSKTTIYDSNVYWEFEDSKQNQYEWVMPMHTFEEYVKHEPNKMFYYDEQSIPVEEFSPYVMGSFDQVIDEVYENSLNDDDFIQELWYITSQLTVYSSDIGENPRYAIETLTRGGGDCEDTAILLADFLISSQHTKNWDVWLVDLDSDNPSDLQQINHVIVAIDIDKSDESVDYFIETTTKDLDYAFNAYDYIDGYWFPVEKQT